MRAAKEHLRVVFCIEEVGRAEVGVSRSLSRVDARHLDARFKRGPGRLRLVNPDRGVELLETALHLRHHHVPHRESDIRVNLIERPGHGAVVPSG